MVSLPQHNRRQLLGASALILLCIGVIGLLQVPQLQRVKQRSQLLSAEELNRQLDAEQLRLELLQNTPTFGFDNLISDWTFINFLQYFGDDDARRKTSYRLSPEFFEVIVTHDPHFLEAYTYLSTSTSLYAGLPEQAVALMGKGLESLSPGVPPGSFYVWRNKAIDELLFLGDSEAARQSFEQAAAWASASELPEAQAVAAMSQQTALFLANNPTSKFAQIGAWMMVLNTAVDERTRETAIDRIQQLGGRVTVDADGNLRIEPPAED